MYIAEIVIFLSFKAIFGKTIVHISPHSVYNRAIFATPKSYLHGILSDVARWCVKAGAVFGSNLRI